MYKQTHLISQEETCCFMELEVVTSLWPNHGMFIK